MHRLRALAVGLGLFVGLGLPVAGAPGSAAGPTIACAAETGPRAVLVVDAGGGAQRFCVALDGTMVSGIRLIELASAQHGLSYSLGFGKQAVCQLDGIGPSGGECFAYYPDFWGYWHGNGGGGWTWASGGAATYRVGDGDVEGWVWGSGDTPSTHPAPPTTHADDVCPPAPPPEPPPTKAPDAPNHDPSGNGGGGTGSEIGAASPSPRASASPREREPEERERERDRTASPTPSPTPVAGTDDEDLRAAGATVPDDAGGPPFGLVAAIALGLALAGAGWWRVRRSAGGGAA